MKRMTPRCTGGTATPTVALLGLPLRSADCGGGREFRRDLRHPDHAHRDLGGTLHVALVAVVGEVAAQQVHADRIARLQAGRIVANRLSSRGGGCGAGHRREAVITKRAGQEIGDV